jgi:hypothetical protein
VVGVPASSLVPVEAPSVRERTAARLANWTQTGEIDQLTANVALVDGLLGARHGLGAFVRRQLWIPRSEIAAIYQLADPDSARARIWQVAHVPKLCVRFLLGLAGFRGRSAQAGRHGGGQPPV